MIPHLHPHAGDCEHACCLKIEHLSVRIGGEAILDDINLHMHCGQMVALIGPNGAGKSTLIRHLTGIYRPDSGVIDIDGQPVYENPAVKARIAYIPDDVFYFPQATIPDMMRYYRGIYPKFDTERYQKLGEVFQLRRAARSWSRRRARGNRQTS